MSFQQTESGATISTYADGGDGSNEVHTVAPTGSEAVSRRTRFFGYSASGGVRSFDVIVASEETAIGNGVEIQNGGRAGVDGGSIGVPGTFPGQAIHLYSASIVFDRSLRAGCKAFQ